MNFKKGDAMPNETKCPTCGGEISSKTCDGCKGICVRYIRKPGWPSDEAVCWDCKGEGIQDIKSIAAARAEREAWERHCHTCLYRYPWLINGEKSPKCSKRADAHHNILPRDYPFATFDTCPLRPKNVASSNSHDETRTGNECK